MPKLRTHYDNLKVSRDAPIEVIQAAYRSLARKYHPDRNGGTPEGEAAMKAINAAYEVLSDPQKRAEHDRWIAAQSGRVAPADPGTDRRRAGAPSVPDQIASLLFSFCFFTTALWLLRNPAARLVGIVMLVAGLFYLLRRRR